MKTCPFCREEIRIDAIKCRYCKTMLIEAKPNELKSEDITYILDKDLVRFAKFALSVLAIFTIVGLFLFGIKLNDMSNQLAKAREKLTEAQTKLISTQSAMDSGLVKLNESTTEIDRLQTKSNLLVERAESSLGVISQNQSRSEEILVAMETSSGGSAVVIAKVTSNRVSPKSPSRAKKLWENGSKLNIAFIGGEESIHKKVKEVALKWTEYANLKFDFEAEPENANIRISFEKNSGSWSYIGIDARKISSSSATMNISFDQENNLFKSSILRYFGHAIGLLNEHQNPNSTIQWDEEFIYKRFSDPPNNWTRETIYNNFIRQWSSELIHAAKKYDSDSIMHYEIPKNWTKNNFEVKASQELSDGDKEWIGFLYPKN